MQPRLHLTSYCIMEVVFPKTNTDNIKLPLDFNSIPQQFWFDTLWSQIFNFVPIQILFVDFRKEVCVSAINQKANCLSLIFLCQNWCFFYHILNFGAKINNFGEIWGIFGEFPKNFLFKLFLFYFYSLK